MSMMDAILICLPIGLGIGLLSVWLTEPPRVDRK